MSGSAFVVAGTHSGSGKTTVTLGLMAALQRRGLSVMPFKCGPDFIDPSLHRLVTGTISRNLDLWMMGETFCAASFARHMEEADIGVVEGVMGMFDGGPSSSAALAKTLGVPLILVLDVRSAAESAAAVLKGFENFDPDMRPAGVILNMVGSERHRQLVTDAITRHCRTEILGILPRDGSLSLPSRHLGLHMGEEQPLSTEQIDMLADLIARHVDLDRLLQLAGTSIAAAAAPSVPPPLIRLGIARDRAFCFYYQDNLDLLRQAGAELLFFSPLTDKHLPEGLDALYLGGGYPELHAAQLSANHGMLADIREWAEAGRPLYAECGGFMYLTRGITDRDGAFHALAGVFPTSAVMQTRRASLGYREIATSAATFFGPPGTMLRGHEFHYSTIQPMNDSIERVFHIDNGSHEGYRLHNVIGGYMHIHFAFNEKAVRHFIEFCKEQPCPSPYAT